MLRSEIFQLFENVNCAKVDGLPTPHKPLVLLMLLEMVAAGHPNEFFYSEFNSKLYQLLEKYGSSSAPESRAMPFYRLASDGIYTLSTGSGVFSAFQESLTPTRLIEQNVSARLTDDLFQSLRSDPNLCVEIARAVLQKFVIQSRRATMLADAAPTLAARARSYWWVSQNKTYKEEVGGDFMWSPQTNSTGGRNINYDFMREIEPGDVIFSFSDSQIKAIGIATNPAVASPKPTSFGSRGDRWLDNGWLVEVAFYELGAAAIRPAEHMHLLAATLPDRYSPIRENGIGNQVYLTPVPELMASVLIEIIGPKATVLIDRALAAIAIAAPEQFDAQSEAQVMERSDISQTQKEQLVLSRRGQGLFRTRVKSIEPHCRITRVSEKAHLRTSHIKPWKSASDDERLDRYNGLLLAPHADHLFDRGYLSFKENGQIIVSKRLDPDVLATWNIDPTMNVGRFHEKQAAYLAYHQDVILLR